MSHGQFAWYELMTTDPAAAEPFYRQVVGWNARNVDNPLTPYTVFNAGEFGVAGMMPLPREACEEGARPGWIGYIAVDDVDAYADKVQEAGGSLHRPPCDIPGVGRFAVVADPHGAAFILFKPLPSSAPTAPFGTPGTAGWRELYSGKMEDAFAFYSKLFGWTKDQAIDMGPMGTYQLFATNGGEAAGGMMTKAPEMPGPPSWLYYFIVDKVDSAMDRVRSGGGDILHGPSEVPGGSWIVHARDPQGAMFALVGPQR